MGTRTIGAPLIEVAAAVDRPKVRLSEYGFTVLQIETLLACNMACSFCAYPLLEDKGARLDDATVLRLLDQVDPDDPEFEYVCFSHYNEPLLDDRVYGFVRAARERGLRSLVITNGLAFRSPDTIERLLDAEPDYVKISFQTASRHKFYQSRGTGVSFEKYALTVIDFLRAAAERGGPTKVTVDFACNFMPWYQRLGRALLGIEAGDPSVRNSLRDLSPYVTDCVESVGREVPALRVSPDVTRAYLASVGRHYVRQDALHLADNVAVKVKRFIYGRRLSDFRPAGRTQPCETRILGVLSNGLIVPCCLTHEDLLAMGDARRELLVDVLERSRPLVEGIHAGRGMPAVCRTCQGAPTRRGALVMSGIRAYRERPVVATIVTISGAAVLAFALWLLHPAAPTLSQVLYHAWDVSADFVGRALEAFGRFLEAQ